MPSTPGVTEAPLCQLRTFAIVNTTQMEGVPDMETDPHRVTESEAQFVVNHGQNLLSPASYSPLSARQPLYA